MVQVPTPPSIQPTFSNQDTAIYAAAPWSVKRLLLAGSLAKSAKTNEKQTITTSITAYDLTDKKMIYAHDVDFEHYAASTQKIPVVELVLQDMRAGKVSMDTVVSWKTTDQRAGAGTYDQPGAPTTGTVRDVIFDLLNRSGNTAVRILVNKVLGGADATNTRLAAYPQLKVTRLQPVDSDRFLVGYTTARESSFMFGEFYKHNDQYTEFAKNALATNIFNDYGPRSQVQDPNKMVVIDKQGMLNDPEGNNRHDIGVIKNKKDGHQVLYTLFTTSPGDTEDKIPPAEQSLKDMGRSILVYDGDSAPKQKSQSPAPQSLRSAAPSAIENGRIVY